MIRNRNRVLCGSLNTSTGKPCKNFQGSCSVASHKQPNRNTATPSPALAADTQPNFSDPSTGTPKTLLLSRLEANIAAPAKSLSAFGATVVDGKIIVPTYTISERGSVVLIGWYDQISLDGTISPTINRNIKGTEAHLESCVLYTTADYPNRRPSKGLVIAEGLLSGALAHSISHPKSTVMATKNKQTFISSRFCDLVNNLLRLWEKPTKVTVVSDSTTESTKSAERLAEQIKGEAQSVQILKLSQSGTMVDETCEESDMNTEGLIPEHKPAISPNLLPDSEQGWVDKEKEMRHEYERLSTKYQQASGNQRRKMWPKLKELETELGLLSEPEYDYIMDLLDKQTALEQQYNKRCGV